MAGKRSTSNNSIAIRLTNVSKRYTIHHEKPTLVEHLIKGRNEKFWAFNNINLEIKKGEKVDITNHSGSRNVYPYICKVELNNTNTCGFYFLSKGIPFID